jgi:ligand-binding sensor domain-containing protein/serine phosphatase RsbU (regulator of sigma subunit)
LKSFLKNTLLILLWIACFHKAHAQSYQFRNYTPEHGLAQSQVLCIFQDSKGYIWFGTNSGGVSKFNGHIFETINRDNGIPDDVVYSICENKNGDIILGTGNGISIIKNSKGQFYNINNLLKGEYVFKVYQHRETIWIGTQNGVYRLRNDSVIPFKSISVLNESAVWDILVDKNNNVWFATLQNGLILFQPQSKQTKHYTAKNGLSNDLVFSLNEKPDGEIFAGTQFGLNIIDQNFNARKASEIRTNDNISIRCITRDAENVYYFGTDAEGIFKHNFNTQISEVKFNLQNGLTSNPILSCLKDREGNLWIGTDGSGVYKYYNEKFSYFTTSNGLKDNYINCAAEDAIGNLWIAVRNNGLVKINKGKIESFKFNPNQVNSLPDNSINAILPLSNGDVYFGTQDGLCLMSNGMFTVKSNNNFRHSYILSLFRDSKGTIWIGTNKGVYTLNQKNEITEKSEINNLELEGNQFLILFINEDHKGNIWIGTEEGVICYAEGKATLYNANNKFISKRINNCIIDSKGNMWLGTENGIYLYRGGQFIPIGKEYLLPIGYINFLQLVNNNLYVGTNNGIHILNLNDFYTGKKQVRHLGKEDGLLNLESNANAAAIDSQGRLLVGTISGLQIYDPKYDYLNTKEPALHITSVDLFYGQQDVFEYADKVKTDQQLPVNLELPSSKNNLTFKFIGISLIAPEKVRYVYRLAGLEDNWAPQTKQNEVTYSSLPPGTYTFMVKAMNNDGYWNKEASSFTFTISPPWYNTWWFYSLSAIGLLAAAFGYSNFKTKKLKRDKEKLEMVVNIRTSELRKEKEKVESINKEVIEQKAEIENKNKEITDSIKYAKNIQEALLPPLTETEHAFEECFILYLPKDIVSGDFFWHTYKNNLHYIAAADCTGHGVPGAFMSIVGNTLLNEIVNHNNIVTPGDILLELHRGVKEALKQSNEENERRDGMDIALCAIDFKNQTIHYAGANRPLWIFRKNKHFEAEIIKPSKFPIGGLELEENRIYESHTISLEKGDSIYIFSDGFADQFGGPKGKKFMVSNMQKLIQENIRLDMLQQKKNIHESFSLWKNNLEQVDDVLMIGIRI